ncbi:hypothetical protein VB735_34590 [Halotia wernerae UHCC 0503]|nr:hypothetical protein [Halotia wernerae UHCC 0503]
MFYHRKLPRVFFALTALPFLLGTTAFAETFFTSVKTVYADTPGNREDIRHVSFRMSDHGSYSLRSNYTRMLRNLREAVGHRYRNNVDETQSNQRGAALLLKSPGILFFSFHTVFELIAANADKIS